VFFCDPLSPLGVRRGLIPPAEQLKPFSRSSLGVRSFFMERALLALFSAM